MTGHNLPIAPKFVGGCVIPEPPRQLPLDQRVDLAGIDRFNEGVRRARESYYAASEPPRKCPVSGRFLGRSIKEADRG